MNPTTQASPISALFGLGLLVGRVSFIETFATGALWAGGVTLVMDSPPEGWNLLNFADCLKYVWASTFTSAPFPKFRDTPQHTLTRTSETKGH
jgi:hypothetical protein